MKFLAYFGHLNIDVSMSVSSLPTPGEARGVDVLREKFAGTAGNFAYVANSLGLDFDLYSIVGLTSHAKYLENLKEVGISIEHVDIDAGEIGPICYIPSDGKEQIAYMFQGPMNNWEASKKFEYENYLYLNIGTGPVKEYQRILSQENTNKIMKDYRLTVKKYYKYNMKSRSSTGIMRKHAIRMRDQCLQHILDDYEAIKKIKMDVINEEVYKEWKQKQKT